MKSSNPIGAVELDELRRLEREATPGPVLIERREDDDGSIDWIAYSPAGDFAACFETANENARANAHLIVAMRNALPALLSAAEALESERTLRRSLESVAIQIMRCCNERPECPFCGIDDGAHEPGELCSMLDDTLNPPSPSGPGGGKEP